MLTDSQLSQIMPTLAAAKRQQFLPNINAAMLTYEVNTVLRAAAFLAQLAHESGEFRWMEEIWGPTPAQIRYEPPSDLAARLGNTQPGDGKLYKGRGPIQITGRFNYKKYGDLLGIDLIGNPAQAASPDVAFSVAGLFWTSNHLNELADSDQFVSITKRINGGTNGLDDRQKYYERAKAVLAGGTFGDAPATRSGRSAAAPKPIDIAPLSRGQESIVESDEPAGAPAKKAAGKKAVAKKAPGKKAAAKRAPAKKAPAKKAAAPAAKKAPAKTAPAKKSPAKKAAAKKAPAKKAPAKKTKPK